MSALPLGTRGPSQPGRTIGRSPGPSLSIVTRDGTSGRSRAHLDHPADATRARRLLGTEIRYIDHPSFDDPGAHDEILAPLPAADVARAPRRTEAPAKVPPYLASLYQEGPLLSREQEAHLFRKMNYLTRRSRNQTGFASRDGRSYAQG
jgi:RNA polymerase primary sigma factor